MLIQPLLILAVMGISVKGGVFMSLFYAERRMLEELHHCTARHFQ